MKSLLFSTVLIVCMHMGLGKSSIEDGEYRNTDVENRQFGFFGTAVNGATSVTIGNAGLIGLGSILAPLIAIGGALLLWLLTQGDDDNGYSSYGSGYSSARSSARSIGKKFNPYGINWENLSILDWISMGQEAWEKYDASNIDCQKRLICEIHQNRSKFGGPANTMVQLFGYLHYAELLSLPDEVKIMLEEYMDASEKGKSMKKDCGEIFEACDFSVNGMLSKFSTNQI